MRMLYFYNTNPYKIKPHSAPETVVNAADINGDGVSDRVVQSVDYSRTRDDTCEPCKGVSKNPTRHYIQFAVTAKEAHTQWTTDANQVAFTYAGVTFKRGDIVRYQGEACTIKGFETEVHVFMRPDQKDVYPVVVYARIVAVARPNSEGILASVSEIKKSPDTP